MARPDKTYTPDLAWAVLDRVAEGMGLKKVCEEVGIPYKDVRRWAVKDVEGFQSRLEAAREDSADTLADRIMEIAEDTLKGDGYEPNAAKVAIDAYKWTASKLKPGKFGDRVEHKLTASTDFVKALEMIDERRSLPEPEVIDAEYTDV